MTVTDRIHLFFFLLGGFKELCFGLFRSDAVEPEWDWHYEAHRRGLNLLRDEPRLSGLPTWIVWLINCLLIFARSVEPLLFLNKSLQKGESRRVKVNHARLCKQPLIWWLTFLFPCQRDASLPSPLVPSLYTSTFARTCLTRSGKIALGCVVLTVLLHVRVCVSYKHTFVCISAASLCLRCDFSFGWQAVRAWSYHVMPFACLRLKVWTHLTW